MGRAINWMAYIWLLSTETVEELFYRGIGDFLRRFAFDIEPREGAVRIEHRMLTRKDTAAKATDTI